MGEKKLSDGKTIGGKGRLTDAIISKLTTFMAMLFSHNNVNEMRQAVWAVWAHTSSTDDEPKHWFCPKGKIAGSCGSNKTAQHVTARATIDLLKDTFGDRQFHVLDL
ncbi:hypothetical protein TNCV_1706311 [Trichonephila clavipes]|nr:hypothetical protein TNCV_1706311 [Trichonephila clavipes]